MVSLSWIPKTGWKLKRKGKETEPPPGTALDLKDGDEITGPNYGGVSDSTLTSEAIDSLQDKSHRYCLDCRSKLFVRLGDYEQDDGTVDTCLYFELVTGYVLIEPNESLAFSRGFVWPFLIRVKTSEAVTGTRGTKYEVDRLLELFGTNLHCFDGEVRHCPADSTNPSVDTKSLLAGESKPYVRKDTFKFSGNKVRAVAGR